MDKLNKPKKASLEDWHPADIIAALRKAGWSLRQLSLHYKLSAGTLKVAIQMPYPNGERLIAAAIGLKPQDIWPSRYDSKGQPNRGRKMRGFKQFNANHETCNVKVNGGV
ncbi:helix-turn-helix domain-containing protein [Methylomonas sp. EFPC1]|uniref:helix-turn-helix domain-containing protein n=1 Tax=Methylomonas sp. EFPC1 TaxID=2812647 RepID=UPI0019684782|nr:helix-turn-helix transcriptional regulator [Methylomonas sp. EFPC1]QSB02677.1 helix-turn-helix domain-containing protein [Methylomonas sp. EFPC1]